MSLSRFHGFQIWQQLEHRDLQTGDSPASSYGHSACVLSDRSIFLFGGKRPPGDASARSDYFGLSGTSHTSATKSAHVTSALWRFRLPADYGEEGGSARPGNWGSWSAVQRAGSNAWPSARAFHTAVVLADSMLVYGGIDARSTVLSDMWLLREDVWQAPSK